MSDLSDMQAAVKKAAESAKHTIHKVVLHTSVECSCGYSGSAQVEQFPNKANPTCPNCGATETNDTGLAKTYIDGKPVSAKPPKKEKEGE